MAHDITFANATNYDDEPIFLFGYYSGIFYEKFNVTHFDMGISGNGGRIRKSKIEVLSILDDISETDIIKNYPDPKRFSDLYEQIKNSAAIEYIIQFS